MKNDYRRAKKFRLDEDLEVADIFTGNKKQAIKGDWWGRIGDDRRNWELHGNQICRMFDRNIGKSYNDIKSYFKRKYKNTNDYKNWTMNVIFDRCGPDRTVYMNGDVILVDGFYQGRRPWPGMLYVSPEGIVKREPKSKKKRYEKKPMLWDHHCPRQVMVGNVHYFEKAFEYNFRLDSGEQKTIYEYHWMKKYTVMVDNYYETKVGGEYKILNHPYQKEILESVSKAEIKKYKLNEIEKE